MSPSDAPKIPDLTSGEWTSLFDGKSLAGWNQKNGWAQFRIEGDCIVGTTAVGSPNSFLCTKKDYGNFELRFEVKVADGLNSGVQFRSKSIAEKDNGRVHGPQVEIEAGPGEAGYIYGEATGRNWLSPDPKPHSHFRNGEWNQYVVRAEGPRMTTWINGQLIEDIVDPASYSEGFIGLQVHGIGKDQGPFEVRWKNIAIRNVQASPSEEGLVKTPPTGFRVLYNGKDFTGWHGFPGQDPRKYAETSEQQKKDWNEDLAKHWKADGEVLFNDGQGAYATTDATFGDFELLLQYKTVAKADSGIYLRGVPQVQIWDYTEKEKFPLGADKGSGGLWNNSPGAPGKDPAVLADKPFGQWNQMRIQLVGERCSVWLNDKLVVDHARMENYFDRKSPLFASGPIELQTHGKEISWRHIFVRDIPAAEATKILREKTSGKFKPLFNGKDLSGWKGSVENYEVVDGAIQCRAGKGGTLYTEEKFKDFIARLEFQLPPGGNNGLAIRYPGTGDPAYTGMCELQVLDNEADKYKKLDPRQYHGSAYGMAAAHRGFLRPTGEWNYQVVKVQGSKIEVELNGTRILSTDLSEIKEYMANSPHPGKDLPEGYFGFAGHGDPVRFRNVEIVAQ